MTRRTDALYAVFILILIIVALAIWAAGNTVAGASGTHLPKPLPTTSCSRLTNGSLHGKALWKHWIWHLRRSEYRRICSAIAAESHWQPSAENSAGYAGLPQFGRSWYAGRWHFDPHNAVLSIRVMVYVLRHPKKTGGWSNWSGH